MFAMKEPGGDSNGAWFSFFVIMAISIGAGLLGTFFFGIFCGLVAAAILLAAYSYVEFLNKGDA